MYHCLHLAKIRGQIPIQGLQQVLQNLCCNADEIVRSRFSTSVYFISYILSETIFTLLMIGASL